MKNVFPRCKKWNECFNKNKSEKLGSMCYMIRTKDPRCLVTIVTAMEEKLEGKR